MDQLATELQALKGAGHAQPFKVVDLRKHVPRWATTGGEQHNSEGKSFSGALPAYCKLRLPGDAEQPLSKEIAAAVARSINPGVGADKKNPLTWNQWVLACPRYALEASACGMLNYAAAMGHMVRLLARCSRTLPHRCYHQAVCQRVAETAAAEGRQRWLAILYDEAGPCIAAVVSHVRLYAGMPPRLGKESLCGGSSRHRRRVCPHLPRKAFRS